MKLGICGLPVSGKTTAFNALTGAHRAVGAFENEAHLATVHLPDPRLDRLAAMFSPPKVVPASIDYLDIPGVRKDAPRDDLVRVLTALRDADALVEVIRYFDHPAVPHPLGSLDPLRDHRDFQTELIIADLDIAEKRVERIEKDMKRPRSDAALLHAEYDMLRRCKKVLDEGRPVRELRLSPEDQKRISSFQFLTDKPLLRVLNVGENVFHAPETQAKAAALGTDTIVMCGELEMEIGELDEAERPEFLKGLGIEEPCSTKLIHASYALLGLRSFFTIGKDEIRAWTIHQGDDAVTAAGKVHTDMARGFIRAEVVHFNELAAAGGMKEAKAAGKWRLEGRGYKVQDGDVIQFRFNV